MTSCHTKSLTISQTLSSVVDTGKVLLLLICFAFSASSVRAQNAVPEFSVDVVSSKSEESDAVARVDVYARVTYSSLTFISTPNGFSGSYEMSLSATEVSDDDRFGTVVQSPIWDGNILVDTYLQTQVDENSDFTTQSLTLSPGRYIFEFELTDKNSSQVFYKELPITVKNFDAPTTVSDLTLLESYDPDTFSIIPRVDQVVYTTEGGVQLFYEVNSEVSQDVTVRRQVFRTVHDGSVPAIPAWIELSGAEGDGSDSIVQSEDELTQLPSGKSQHLVTIPVEDFTTGGYLMRISLLGSDGQLLDHAAKAFIVQWSGLAAHIQNIDDAIQQLEYIAKRKDLNYILDAANTVERYQRFETFWDKRDPTPNTKRNESMEEYYYRVASANRQYGAVEDGWRTDRGFVFVRFGEPDYVERKPHSFDYEPYEIWIYERIGRQFIFVDRTGFGDYDLLVPIWDERTRLY